MADSRVMHGAISVKNLQKKFHDFQVFDDLSFVISSGSVAALFGPNGCGKSTLLNIIAGIVPMDGGECHIENFNHYKFSYIFQNYRESLLPWRTNFENIAFPLELQGLKKGEIKKKAEEARNFFQFKFEWDDYPYMLSGGQQQMLAFMRALIIDPKILIIDEPFSALDYENNLQLRECLQRYYLLHRPTVLMITHDIEEAVHLAGKILVLSRKPTKVLEEIDNPLPYPRNWQSLKSESFHLVRDKVLSVFQQAANI